MMTCRDTTIILKEKCPSSLLIFTLQTVVHFHLIQLGFRKECTVLQCKPVTSTKEETCSQRLIHYCTVKLESFVERLRYRLLPLTAVLIV